MHPRVLRSAGMLSQKSLSKQAFEVMEVARRYWRGSSRSPGMLMHTFKAIRFTQTCGKWLEQPMPQVIQSRRRRDYELLAQKYCGINRTYQPTSG